MNFYQIYWDTYYEACVPINLLGHSKYFSQDEFNKLVSEALSATGNYTTFLKDIEDYLVEHHGFKIVPIIFSNTEDC